MFSPGCHIKVQRKQQCINRSRFCCKFAKTKSQIKFKNAFGWLRPLWLRHIGIWSSQDMKPDVFTFALAKKYHFQFQLFIFIPSKQITTQFLLVGAIVCHRTCVLHSTKE